MVDPQVQDEELVARCLAGDAGAWEEFVRAYTPLIQKAVRKSLGRAGLAPAEASQELDAVQEVLAFLAHPASSPLRRFRWECPLPHYLAVVAAQRCLRSLRSRQAYWEEFRLAPLLEDLAVARKALPLPEQEESALKVQRAVGQLPARERLLVQLFYWDGIPAETLSRLMGMSRAAVFKALSRSRDRLRRILKSLPLLLIF